ncbi:hypothetical protein HMPREF1207_00844 [Paenibacillus sp. HGH0039]|nr:hypothetical protein HMPREF1207_00844 [Paenibacillus sp. HGH0039]
MHEICFPRTNGEKHKKSPDPEIGALLQSNLTVD